MPFNKLVVFTPETTMEEVAGTIPFAMVLSGINTGVELVNVKGEVVVPVELSETVFPAQIIVSDDAAVTVTIVG